MSGSGASKVASSAGGAARRRTFSSPAAIRKSWGKIELLWQRRSPLSSRRSPQTALSPESPESSARLPGVGARGWRGRRCTAQDPTYNRSRLPRRAHGSSKARATCEGRREGGNRFRGLVGAQTSTDLPRVFRFRPALTSGRSQHGLPAETGRTRGHASRQGTVSRVVHRVGVATGRWLDGPYWGWPKAHPTHPVGAREQALVGLPVRRDRQQGPAAVERPGVADPSTGAGKQKGRPL